MPYAAARIACLTVPAMELLGFLAGRASGSGYGNSWFDSLRKPVLMPPGWAFPVAWGLLYALLGIALALILATRATRARRIATMLFAVQLLVNLTWSPAFFGLHQPRLGLAIITAMTALALLTAFAFHRIRPAAAYLMLPYLVWLCFAAFLNAEIIRLN